MHFGSAAADQLFEIRCDVLTKLHQGTHSKDAFTNNLHELAYHIRCTDGTELHITQDGVPDAIPAEACYLGWSESLDLLKLLVEPQIPDQA